MILNSWNLLSFTKNFYENAVSDINKIMSLYEENDADLMQKLNNIFWENNLVEKINIVEGIEKLKHHKNNLENIDIWELNSEMPEIFLNEKIKEIIHFVTESYTDINYLEKYLQNIFLKTKNLEKSKNFYNIFEDNFKEIIKNSLEFKEFAKKYKTYSLSKELLDKLNTWFFGFWVKNYKMSMLVVLVILIAWIASLITIPKESSPKIDFWMISITTTYLWASPEDMDNLVTSKIEKEIKDIKWISKITSNSWNGFSSTLVELKNWVDVAKAKQEISDKVDTVSLPASADDPRITDISTDNKLMFQLIIYWNENEYSFETLLSKAQSLKSKIEWKDWITSIDILWSADWSVQTWWSSKDALFDIEVILDRNKLENIWLSLNALSNIIRANNKNQPIWTFNIEKLNYDFRINWELANTTDLESIIIPNKNWSFLTLRDIAEIKLVPKNEWIYKYWKYNNSWNNYVSLNINKSEWANIFTNAKTAKNSIKETMWDFEFNWIWYSYASDLSDILIEDYKNLANNWISTIVLVFITLMFFVWIKEAVIASIILPLAFLITFTVLNLMGLTLNFLTNFSLILTLWIAIDTIIVVIEWASHKMKLWYNPLSAVLIAVREYKSSLISWTATTLVAFFPMMFLPGIMWKFLAYIPITIFATLIAWLILSLTILSAIYYIFNKPKKTYIIDEESERYMIPEEKALLTQDREWKEIFQITNKIDMSKLLWVFLIIIWIIFFYITTATSIFTFIGWVWIVWLYLIKEKFLHFLANIYWNYLENVLKNNFRRKLALIIPVIVLILTFVLFGPKLVSNFQLFPSWDVDYLTVSVSKKTWTTKEEMIWYTKELDKNISQIKEVDSYITSLNWNSISTTINLLKKKDRQEKWLRRVFDIQDELRNNFKTLEVQWLKVSVEVPSNGPPWGKAIWINLVTYDNTKFRELINVSKDFEEYLQKTPWFINVWNSSSQTPGQFIFKIKKEKLASLWLTSNDIIWEIYFALNWLKSWSIKSRFEDREIVLKYDDLDKNISPDKILATSVLTQAWKINLGTVLDYNIENSVSQISRENWNIQINVSAWVEKWYPTLELQKTFMEFASKYSFPKDITYIQWWENSENADLLIAVWVSFIVAIILIFTILVLQFGSYAQPLIIMYSIVLSMIWVNLWLVLTGNAYSMTFGIWFISLTWIVVNDAILLIDTINWNLKKWLVWYNALIQSWKSRLEPIMVTTLTTCFWLLPIAMQDEFWAWLWYTVVFWLFTWTFFTITIIPVIYYELFLKEKKGSIFKKIFRKKT